MTMHSGGKRREEGESTNAQPSADANVYNNRQYSTFYLRHTHMIVIRTDTHMHAATHSLPHACGNTPRIQKLHEI